MLKREKKLCEQTCVGICICVEYVYKRGEGHSAIVNHIHVKRSNELSSPALYLLSDLDKISSIPLVLWSAAHQGDNKVGRKRGWRNAWAIFIIGESSEHTSCWKQMGEGRQKLYICSNFQYHWFYVVLWKITEVLCAQVWTSVELHRDWVRG